MREKPNHLHITPVLGAIGTVVGAHRPGVQHERVAVEQLDLQLVEVKPAQPTVQRHGLGRQAANAAEMFDDRTERGHHTDGVVVQLDRAR